MSGRARSGSASATTLHGLLDDVATAARSVVSSPSYTLPAVLSLSLGIGATLAVVAIFSAVVLRPLAFGDEDKLVAIFNDMGVEGQEKVVVSPSELEDFRELSRSFESVSAFFYEDVTLSGLDEPRRVVAAFVTRNFFHTMRLTPRMGRGFDAAGIERGRADVAVVSHAFWQGTMGRDPQAIGHVLNIGGRPRTVIGVLEPEQVIPASADVWIPLTLTEQQKTQRSYRFLFGVGRLRNGVSLEAARADMEVVSSRLGETLGGEQARVTTRLYPLREELLGDSQAMVKFLVAAVMLFLLLACANVASLLATRVSVRQRELSIRASVGASAARLAREHVIEAVLLVAVGGVLGTAIALVALEWVTHAYGSALAYTRPRIDWRTGALFAVIAFGTVAAIGAAPALRAARSNPMDALRAGGRGSPGRGAYRVRRALVASQVAVAIILLVGATTLVRYGWALADVSTGWVARGVVSAEVSLPSRKYDTGPRIRQFYQRVLEAGQSAPAVNEIAGASLLPLSDGYAVHVSRTPGGAQAKQAEQRAITPRYFGVLRIPLLEGREFTAKDGPDTERVTIVNEAFAQTVFGEEDVIGQRFTDGSRDDEGELLWWRVVGLVSNSKDFGLNVPAKPTFFLPFAQQPSGELSLLVRTKGAERRGVRWLPDAVHGLDRDVLVDKVRPFAEIVSETYRSQRVLTYILGVFGVVAIILAAIGLFGVTSYSVAQRKDELAIRRALGATRRRIVAMVLGETLVVIGVGVGVGLAGATLLNELLARWLVDVRVADPVTYAASAVVVAVGALAAAAAPASRAASVDPVDSLREG